MASTPVASGSGQFFVPPLSTIKQTQLETESDSDLSRTLTVISGIGPLASSTESSSESPPPRQVKHQADTTM